MGDHRPNHGRTHPRPPTGGTPRGDTITTADALLSLLGDGGLTSHFQPIVDLATGEVVACEALARGPVDSELHTPAQLFGAAREHDLLGELDAACRAAAFRGAVEHGLVAPLTLFVNVEPEVLDSAPLDELLAIAAATPDQLRVVVELTERALAHRPAELLRTVDRIREAGWAVALDDVGADDVSLAFMPLLRPDVVKLDLRLVQDAPGPDVAQVMNAVNAYAEESGAVVLAEGIEDVRHLRLALALGASLGQGWHFGRPAPGRTALEGRPTGRLHLPPPPPLVAPSTSAPTATSPFALLPPGTALRQAPKKLLVELSKQLEREALRLGSTCVVASTFQEAKHFTPATTGRYRDLVERTAFVCALGEDLPAEPLPGVRGAHLPADDPVRGEWDVVVLAPHFSAALLARDLGDEGPDAHRRFEYALTYERGTVAAAGRSLLARVSAQAPTAPPAAQHAAARPAAARPDAAPAATPAVVREQVLPELLARGGPAVEQLLRRALAASTSGVCIADLALPDQPIVYVNPAFEKLSGLPAEEVLGRNCRFLQGPDTDEHVVGSIRAAIRAGRDWSGVLLNHRGPHREPWWNEIHLAPVHDDAGRLVQYVGVQTDVSERVAAQRDLAAERDRSAAYLARIEQLAFTDALTGLANRRRFEERLETALWEARAGDAALAVVLLDLDGFKAVNDSRGHAAGDELLVAVAQRLRRRLRRSDLVCRLGGDEFLLALPGLTPEAAHEEAAAVVASLRAELQRPVQLLTGGEVSVGVSAGVALHPVDGDGFAALAHAADQRMFADKRSEAATR
ncbi:diguanylate cyclase domain-containing protein [Quadrisphaera sp. INWT6]|uniref:diguanylate cyclase domain-containing protein n=1 Tax=Quadrisphaera sp. INWT6 TaxID=2596917 RepID=UPI0018922C77|nr:diguanylate cyclase [Quadrisphaera sp. INWT6]MBF5082537.1 EAL domain-containing protein [Quadrisphaera sp. INWT6]